MRDQRIIMCKTKTTKITTHKYQARDKEYCHTQIVKVKMSNFPQHINNEQLLLLNTICKYIACNPM